MFLIPMAISLGWGIVFATVITLLLIPTLTMIFDDLRRGFAWVYDRDEFAPDSGSEKDASEPCVDRGNPGDG
jgi:predicted RND superfamily exporter protein